MHPGARHSPAHDPAHPSPGTRWHAIDLNALLTLLNTGGSGLTSEEARLRRNRYGPNRLPRRKPASIRQILLRQFKSPLIFILAIAAAVSLLIHPDNPTDALFILAVLLERGHRRFPGIQGRAESSQALLRLLQIRASVLRDGEVQEMDAPNRWCPGTWSGWRAVTGCPRTSAC